jgi:hypothetical protein
MNTTKRTTTGNIQSLPILIMDAVLIQQKHEALSAALSAKKAAIKESMLAAGLERYATDAGAEALLITAKTRSWNVDKLEKVLSDDEFDELCPRKADSKKLDNLMTSMESRAKSIEKCAKLGSTVKLEIRAPEAKESVESADGSDVIPFGDDSQKAS